MGAECCGTNFQGERETMSCGVYREVKLLEHAMKIVEKVLERRLRRMVKVDEMHFKEVTRGVLRQGEEVV